MKKNNFRNKTLLFFLIMINISGFQQCQPEIDSVKKIPTTAEIKPWTRWWWMGNAVTEEGITRHMEAFKSKGLGGVEIVPIYGTKGDEEKFIPYLSDRWNTMLIHCLEEARRLDMAVDIALGSGWPYGGPWIPEEYAARKYQEGHPHGVPTRQKVKRAAPGAEGWVVDHFSPDAMSVFLSRFDSLIERINKRGLPLRAIFNDSYEVYGANWTTDFINEFQQRRGYDILTDNEFTADKPGKASSQVWTDYHHTIHELLLETTGEQLREWTEEHELSYRFQAHGSPANLLDLYNKAHIPETESFGSSRFPVPGLDYDRDYELERFSKPDPLLFKFASSPAHIFKKRLVSSETGTWLGNHFKVSLAQLKPQIDELFVSGINHIIYHGIPYSPEEKPWPGNLFYAATHLGPTSGLWEYFGELNEYVTNCQTILQNTQPANDLLLYYPVFDIWQKAGEDMVIMQDVHNPDRWLFNSAFGKTARYLQDEGYMFDYISDDQIRIISANPAEYLNSHKAVLVPQVNYMPLTTLNNLLKLAQQGIEIIFIDHFPAQVPGSTEYDSRMKTFREVLNKNRNRFNIIQENRLEEWFTSKQVFPVRFRQEGIHYIRKKQQDGMVWFITNLGRKTLDKFVSFPGTYVKAEMYDPLKGLRGNASIEEYDTETKIRIQLQPGESVFLFSNEKNDSGSPWNYYEFAGNELILEKGWTLSFSDTVEFNTDSLYSWTELPEKWVPYYSGEATYRFTFDRGLLGKGSKQYRFDLGEVREMATIRLNGREIGKSWCIPYHTSFPAKLLNNKNTLEVDITNLDANRIILMDKKGVDWKKFYDINFVDVTYQPFDASDWEPLKSGLLGPVRITGYE